MLPIVNAARLQPDWTVSSAAPVLSLAGGTLRATDGRPVTEALEPGLKVVLVLDGELRYQVRGGPAARVSGPLLHVSLCRDSLSMDHEFDARGALRFVSLRTPLAQLRQGFALEPDEIAGWLRAPGQARPYAETNLEVGRAMQALGHQMLACPAQGAIRRMYLTGKALELAAQAFMALRGESGEGGGGSGPAGGLSRADAERLHFARELVLRNLQQPPALPDLARAAGINVNKLTTGFRRLFGQSVYAFVREARMARAHAMLASGEITVSEAAYACGYTDSHFTKAFLRRYGVLPSRLASR